MIRRSHGRQALGTALGVGVLLVAVGASAQEGGRVPFVARLPIGARALAMGGATGAIRDADALFGNPAIAGVATGYALSVARYRSAASAAAMSAASTVGPVGVSAGALYLDYSLGVCLEGDACEQSPLLERGPSAALSLVGGAAVSMPFKGLRLGAGLKYAEERARDSRSSVLAVDLGASKDFTYGTLGLVAQNLGPAMKQRAGVVSGPSRDLAARIALSAYGLGAPIGSYIDIAMSAGVALVAEGFVSASYGAEATLVPIEGVSFALRQGVRRPENQDQDPWTGGLGASLDRVSVDYAYEQLATGFSHRVTIRLR
jgi:hypothetical protein